MTDVWTLLQARRRRDGGLPLVTYVDAATGERTELSATSVENAAAKIANALQLEYDLEPGDRVALHLPLHWQRATWCGGIWFAGCVAAPDAPVASLAVCGPDEAAARTAGGAPVAVVSLHPFGLPIPTPLPGGAEDVTVTVRQQPDAYLGTPPSAADPALDLGGTVRDQGALLDWARSRGEAWGLADGGRLLVDATTDPVDAWLAALAVPLACAASVVLVRGDGSAVADQERVTARA